MHIPAFVDLEIRTTSPVTIVSRVSLITADVLLGLATWYKLSAGGMRRKSGTFAYTLLMDGEPHPPSPPELGMLTVCLC